MHTPHAAENLEQPPRTSAEIEMPSPTAWPFVLALGVVLMFAGLVTSGSVAALGVILSLAASAGWFREVFPHEHEVAVPVVPHEIEIATERQKVQRFPIAPEAVRAWLPLETYPISAGVKGGWAGSIAMAALACTYGIIKAGSIWYPINLLAGVAYAQSARLTTAELSAFHLDSFLIALVLHGITSTLVGLLYGAMLPMIPRRPILLGGLIAPALWSGLLYTILGLLNPLLESRINWFWFVLSQIGFGVVAGIVVIRQNRVPTRENIPFALRAGIEAPGMMHTKEGGEKRP